MWEGAGDRGQGELEFSISHSLERSACGKGSLGDQLVLGSLTRLGCSRKVTFVSPQLIWYLDHFRHSDCLSMVILAVIISEEACFLSLRFAL